MEDIRTFSVNIFRSLLVNEYKPHLDSDAKYDLKYVEVCSHSMSCSMVLYNIAHVFNR